MKTLVSRFFKDESGATAIEYGLIAAVIAIVLITAMGLLEDDISELFGRIGGKLDAQAT